MIERTCKDKSEAQALANFLWNEKQRHYIDIIVIDDDLDQLKKNGKSNPKEKRNG